MAAHSVNVGSSITLTATFLNAAGTAASYNLVAWSYQAVTNPANPTQSGGIVNIKPANPPGNTAQITGVYPGLVTVMASPDTNPEVVVTSQVTVIDTSNTPVSGSIN